MVCLAEYYTSALMSGVYGGRNRKTKVNLSNKEAKSVEINKADELQRAHKAAALLSFQKSILPPISDIKTSSPPVSDFTLSDF